MAVLKQPSAVETLVKTLYGDKFTTGTPQPGGGWPLPGSSADHSTRAFQISLYATPDSLRDIAARADECLTELEQLLSGNPYKGFIAGRLGWMADKLELGNLKSLLDEIRREAKGRGVYLFMGIPLGGELWRSSLTEKIKTLARDLGRLLRAVCQRVWLTAKKAVAVAWERFWENLPQALPGIIQIFRRQLD